MTSSNQRSGVRRVSAMLLLAAESSCFFSHPRGCAAKSLEPSLPMCRPS